MVAVRGSDRYGLCLFTICLLGLSAGASSKISRELGWHWLLEDSWEIESRRRAIPLAGGSLCALSAVTVLLLQVVCFKMKQLEA